MPFCPFTSGGLTAPGGAKKNNIKNKSIMKKYLIIAVASLTAVMACTKVDNVNNTTTKDAVINFSVINHSQQTKAQDLPYAGLSYPIDVPFGTFAWWTENNWTGAASDQDYVFMDNEKIVNRQLEASGPYVWAPETTYYWTKTGKITFASYSPYVDASTKASKGFSVIPSYDVAKGFLFTDYTIVDNTDVDVMYADLAKDCYQDTNMDGTSVTTTPTSNFSGVPTIFNHALCRIGFVFRAIGTKNPNVNANKIKIKKVDIKYINNKGSFTQIPETAGNPRWSSLHAAATDYTDYAYLTPDATPQTNAVELDLIDAAATNVAATDNYTAIGTPRILLPQGLEVTINAQNEPVDVNKVATTDQMLVVEYTILTEYTSKLGTWAEEDVTSKVRLRTSDLASWNDNQNITYRISINPYATAPITFDPAVVSWTDIYSNVDIVAHSE